MNHISEQRHYFLLGGSAALLSAMHAGAEASAGASQPRALSGATNWQEGHCCKQLVDKLLDESCTHIMDFMTQAHRPTTSARAVPEPTWKAGSFSKVLHTLKLAYTSHLKHFLNDQWDDSHAKSVRNLADLIKTKLRQHCDADAAQLGEGDLAAMLEHLRMNFAG